MTENTVKKKRGRPPGRFKQNRDMVLNYLRDKAEPPSNNEPPKVSVSNKELAETLKLSRRQTIRYVSSLKQDGLIEVSYNTGRILGVSWVNRRYIYLKG